MRSTEPGWLALIHGAVRGAVRLVTPFAGAERHQAGGDDYE
jgi:hypothetical protein